MIFTYRDVMVYKRDNKHFDYVFKGCAITQRAGFDAERAVNVIDEILDGEQPVDGNVAKHLRRFGHKPLSYEQYSKNVAAGTMQ